MMRKHISLLVSALVMTMAVSAQAGEVSVLGGLDMTGITSNPVPEGMTLSNATKFTFGADYNHAFASNWSLEVGLFYQNKGAKSTSAGIESTVIAKSITTPVMVRYSVLPQYLSLGVGAFTSFGVGSVNIVETPGKTYDETYEKVGSAKFDYGVVGGLRASYPVFQGLDVIGDVRYYLGLKNLNTDPTDPNTTEKSKDIAVLVGVRYAL